MRNKHIKKIFILLTCVVVIISLKTGFVVAADIVNSGKCGERVTWALDASGVLSISGAGEMDYYDPIEIDGETATSAPWGNKIKSVVIGNGITNISVDAFFGCKNLNTISIPDSVTSIGWGAFANTGYYNNDANWENDMLYIGKWLIAIKNNTSGVYAIKDGTVGIALGTFSNCTNLTNLSIPSSMMNIGYREFINTGYYINESNWEDGVLYIDKWLIEAYVSENYTIKNGTVGIADDAFRYCDELKNIVLPNSIKRIGNYAFEGCTNLTAIMIPNSIVSIGNCAFFECTGLESIAVSNDNATYHSAGNCLIDTNTKSLIQGCRNSVIPTDGSVTSISNRAFIGCDKLTDIIIPNSVVSINELAFYDCRGLKSVVIPASVEYIGHDVFTYGDWDAYEFSIPLDAVLSVYEDSYAHQYAIDNGLRYEFITPISTDGVFSSNYIGSDDETNNLDNEKRGGNTYLLIGVIVGVVSVMVVILVIYCVRKKISNSQK